MLPLQSDKKMLNQNVINAENCQGHSDFYIIVSTGLGLEEIWLLDQIDIGIGVSLTKKEIVICILTCSSKLPDKLFMAFYI